MLQLGIVWDYTTVSTFQNSVSVLLCKVYGLGFLITTVFVLLLSKCYTKLGNYVINNILKKFDF